MGKRILLSLMIFVILFVLVGCQQNEVEPEIGEIEEFTKGFKGSDGIMIGADGIMYVASRRSSVISKVNQNGDITDWVTLPCEELFLMEQDEDGNIYAACKHKVFKVNQNGDYTEIASEFASANTVRLDQEGNIYVTDSYRNIVYKINQNNEKSIFIDSDIEVDVIDRDWHITGMVFDHDFENLYVVKMKSGKILKYPLDENGNPGESIEIASSLKEPDHLVIDEEGNIYVTIYRRGELKKITPDGEIETICDELITRATGITLSSGDYGEGFVYIADSDYNAIYKVYIGK